MPGWQRKLETFQLLWVVLVFALYLAQFRAILPRVLDVLFP